MTNKTRKNRKYVGGSNVSPTITDNIKKFADIWIKIVNSIGMYTLNSISNKVSSISKSYGVDPDKPLSEEIMKVSQKTQNLNNALDTPAGRRALQNLRELFNKISNNVIVPSSEKLAEELIKNMQPILLRGQNAVFALLSASPFGAIIDIPRFLSESLGVVESSTTLLNQALDITTNAVDEIKSQETEYNNVKSEFESLMETGNSVVGSTLDSVNNTIDRYNSNNLILDTPTPINMNMNMNNINKLQKTGQMIGGRASKSQQDFLKSHVTTSKIIKQYGGKRKTMRKLLIK
jgi:hypothetical protein